MTEHTRLALWRGCQKRVNITEYICKDTLTYSGIPAHTSDETPKCIVCSGIGEVKEGNGNYCNVYIEAADMDLQPPCRIYVKHI